MKIIQINNCEDCPYYNDMVQNHGCTKTNIKVSDKNKDWKKILMNNCPLKDEPVFQISINSPYLDETDKQAIINSIIYGLPEDMDQRIINLYCKNRTTFNVLMKIYEADKINRTLCKIDKSYCVFCKHLIINDEKHKCYCGYNLDKLQDLPMDDCPKK